jgi:hypothetical protein
MKKTILALAIVASASAAQAYDCQGSYNNIQRHGQDVSGFEIDIYPGGAALVAAEGQVIQTEATHVGYVGDSMVFQAWKQKFVATCTPRGVILQDEFGPRQLLRKGSWVIKNGVVPRFVD